MSSATPVERSKPQNRRLVTSNPYQEQSKGLQKALLNNACVASELFIVHAQHLGVVQKDETGIQANKSAKQVGDSFSWDQTACPVPWYLLPYYPGPSCVLPLPWTTGHAAGCGEQQAERSGQMGGVQEQPGAPDEGQQPPRDAAHKAQGLTHPVDHIPELVLPRSQGAGARIRGGHT